MSRYRFRPPCSEATRRKISAARKGQGVGSANPNWRGGSYINDGYRYQYAPSHPGATQDGYVLEHRLVMEEALGRHLLRSEAVHHKDGDTLNNAVCNLELCESNGRHFIEHHLEDRDEQGRFCVRSCN